MTKSVAERFYDEQTMFVDRGTFSAMRGALIIMSSIAYGVLTFLLFVNILKPQINASKEWI